MPENFMNHQHEPENQNQESVWDYFVEKIKFWTHDPVEKEKIETCNHCGKEVRRFEVIDGKAYCYVCLSRISLNFMEEE